MTCLYNDLSILGIQKIPDHRFLGCDLTCGLDLVHHISQMHHAIVNHGTKAGDGKLEAGLGRPLPVYG
jgi:hypothetical protein